MAQLRQRHHGSHLNHTTQDLITMNISNNSSFSHTISNLLRAYGQWVHDDLDNGFHGYLLSFTFDQIQGSDQTRLLEMKRQLGLFYGRLLKASVPRPSREKWAPYRPR